MYAFQYETKMNSSDNTVVLYLEKVRKPGWRPPEAYGQPGEHRIHGQRLGQCYQRIMVPEVSSPGCKATLSVLWSRPCGQCPMISGLVSSDRIPFPSPTPSFPTRKTQCWASGSTGCCRWSSCRPLRSPYMTTMSLPGGAAPSTTCPQSSLPCGRSVTKMSADVRRCPSPRKDNTRLRQEELQAAARETGVDFVYKVRLKSVKSSTSSPYIYYNMKLEDIIKRGTDSAVSLTMKKFISHATCHDSLGLQEQETYLIMGQISDMWKVKSECVGAPAVPGLSYIYVLGRKTFFMQWPTDGDVGKKELLDHLTGFSDYMSTHGCESWDSEVSTALRRLFPSRHRPLALTPNKEHGVSYPKSIHLSLLQHSSRTLHNQPQHCRDLPPPSPSYTISITLAFSVSFQHPS
ncbi:uncharacterized protein [Callorhinus ursinus]|uniref:uncharacterized protein isoform X2 n=1 Tax=Callorhinus ursinus TaxID=34884 RepID=UPI003CD03A0D